MQMLPIVYFSLLNALVFVISELLYRKLGMKAEYTRIIIHVLCGIECLFLPYFFNDQLPVFIMALSFVLILIVTKWLKLLPSNHAIARPSLGSYMYPIGVYVCFLAFDIHNRPLFFYLPLSIMVFCDPLANLCGTLYPIKEFRVGASLRSVSGCSVFFILAFIISGICLNLFSAYTFGEQMGIAVCLALTGTLAEAMSQQGTDNVVIPMALVGILLYFGIH